jgi:uncharacterized RDD family membrane protein YckC
MTPHEKLPAAPETTGRESDLRYPWHTAPLPTPVIRTGRAAVRGYPAGFVTRALAALADVCVVLLALAAGYAAVAGFRFLLHPAAFRLPTPSYESVLLLAGLVLAGYCTLAWSILGRTYGDQLMGLRVAGRRGARLRWFRAAARAVLCIVFPLGLLWVLVSRHNRSIQDVVLRTAVVYD